MVVVSGGGEADGALDGQVTGHWRLPGHWAERRLWLNRQKWWDSGFCALTSYSRMDYLLKAHYLPTAGPFSQLLAAPGLPASRSRSLPRLACRAVPGRTSAHLKPIAFRGPLSLSLGHWHSGTHSPTESQRCARCYAGCPAIHGAGMATEIFTARDYTTTVQATAGPGQDPSPPGQ